METAKDVRIVRLSALGTLAAVLLLGLSACGGFEPEPQNGPAPLPQLQTTSPDTSAAARLARTWMMDAAVHPDSVCGQVSDVNACGAAARRSGLDRMDVTSQTVAGTNPLTVVVTFADPQLPSAPLVDVTVTDRVVGVVERPRSLK